jgi:hypothetical protein
METLSPSMSGMNAPNLFQRKPVIERSPHILFDPSAGCVPVSAACSDVIESTYSSATDAKDRGAVERGWVPALLNQETFGIRETHNIDTNEVWGTFQFTQGKNPVDPSKVTPVSDEDATKRHFREPDVNWWPSMLHSPVAAANLSRAGFRVYADSEAKVFFAYHIESGIGYFWSATVAGPESR